MESLLEKSDLLVSRVEANFKRYLYPQINWKNRLTGIKGPRGTGKTTLLLQRLHEIGKHPTEAAYFSLDDLFFTTHSLQRSLVTSIRKVVSIPSWTRCINILNGPGI